MPETYTPEQKRLIKLLVRRMFDRKNERGWTYRQVAPILKAECSTVHRWVHGKSMPSQRHIHMIKKFLGVPTV